MQVPSDGTRSITSRGEGVMYRLSIEIGTTFYFRPL
jgi:hypothetical protein